MKRTRKRIIEIPFHPLEATSFGAVLVQKAPARRAADTPSEQHDNQATNRPDSEQPRGDFL
jgi:hypothetical protein